MEEYSLHWEGPWQGKVQQVPEGHEVLAEFPSMLWGWEGDLYAWILRDPSGRKYIGTTSHGTFYEQPLTNIVEDIEMHKVMAKTLQQVVAIVS